MFDEPVKTSPVLWSPFLVGVMAVLILPGGWFLSALNFYRLGFKRQALFQLIALLVFTLILVGVALLAPSGLPRSSGLLVGLAIGYNMYISNVRAIDEFRATGGVVQNANIFVGILISIGAAVVWFLTYMLLSMPFVLFEVFTSG